MEPRTAFDSSEELEPTVLLVRLRSEAFDGSDGELALALGRPVEEVEGWINSDEEPDEDAEGKIRGLAEERL